METNLIEEVKNKDTIINDMYKQISDIITSNKNKMIYQINNTLVENNFMIGKIIVENEQNGNIRAEYGKEILNKLSKKLSNKFGSGYSRSNLQNMRLFYDKYKNCQPVAGNLSWSHYCYLIYIEDDDERNFYEKECINSRWSKRKLKRQIDSSLFQRLLLSNGKTNKQKVLELSRKGQTINKPIDILKDPYVFEFLGIKENKPLLESDLEKRLVDSLSAFLMELGKGFSFVRNQYKVSTENNDYFIDLLFYHLDLRCYIVIELKTTEFKPEYIGQLGFYVAAVNETLKRKTDNQTIGLLLCKSKDRLTAKWSLKSTNVPIGISSFELNKYVSKEVLEKLPTEEDLNLHIDLKE